MGNDFRNEFSTYTSVRVQPQAVIHGRQLSGDKKCERALTVRAPHRRRPACFINDADLDRAHPDAYASLGARPHPHMIDLLSKKSKLNLTYRDVLRDAHRDARIFVVCGNACLSEYP